MKKLIIILIILSVFSGLQAQCDARYFRKCAVTEIAPGLTDFAVTKDNGDKSGTWEGILGGNRISGTYKFDHSIGRFVASVNTPEPVNAQLFKQQVVKEETRIEQSSNTGQNTGHNQEIDKLKESNKLALKKAEVAEGTGQMALDQSGKALLELDELNTQMSLLRKRIEQLEAQRLEEMEQAVNTFNSTSSPVQSKQNVTVGTHTGYRPLSTSTVQSTIYIGMGLRPFKFNQQDVQFSYTDESPSKDYIYNEFRIKERSRALTLHGGFEYKYPSNWLWRINGEVYFGRARGGGGEFAIGYHVEAMPGLSIRPALGLGFSQSTVTLGDIEQNALYIQVNDTKFYSESVRVSVSTPSLSLRPEVVISKELSNDFDLRLGMGYHINIARLGTYLQFSGDDEIGNSVSDSKQLDEINGYLAVNYDQLEKSFARSSGFFVNLCLGFKF